MTTHISPLSKSAVPVTSSFASASVSVVALAGQTNRASYGVRVMAGGSREKVAGSLVIAGSDFSVSSAGNQARAVCANPFYVNDLHDESSCFMPVSPNGIEVAK